MKPDHYYNYYGTCMYIVQLNLSPSIDTHTLHTVGQYRTVDIDYMLILTSRQFYYKGRKEDMYRGMPSRVPSEC